MFARQISFNVTFLYHRNKNKIKLMHSAVELIYSVFLSGVCLSEVCLSEICVSEICLSEICHSECVFQKFAF